MPLTQYDILQKDFKGKKVKQVTSTPLGGKATIILEFIDFKVDNTKENKHFDKFFIKIKQEDNNSFWSKDSFSFDEIIGMDFL